MSDNIKVVVKVRPLISREIEEKLSYQWRVQNNTLYQLDQNGKDLGQSFTFDKVYDKHTKTSAVYDDIAKPIVQAATAGFNGTIFAYGQTSSGKTYTMSGTDSSPGIIPLAVINLFETIKNVPDRDFLVRVSYIEIYNETVKDLLNIEKANIKVTETLQGDVKVLATEKVTSSPEEVLKVMKEGEANRQKGSTNMNEQSSRSHSIFQITIESREHVEGEEEVGCVNVSQLNLVDLAGSERAGQTGATGIRFKEGTHINKSLSALALVIKQLSEDPNKYANYRDSKLTRILSNSLGGNAKTSIICAVTPAAVEETISTLQFANRAKAIKNKPEVNAVATNDTMIQSLTKQMCKLQAQLESKKNLEKDNCKLQNEIANLKKLILNGFVQRHNVDLFSGTRRKLQQPRRITISTLQSIENEPIVSIPKFCTPSLKFNPLTIPKPAELVAPAPARLPSVPEEARARTPPRAPLCSGEVIDLDSDDETPPEDVQTCSPIHKCYGASKTPPCILRRNAKVAERNLKDIVELTEREKIYTPSVVEYIEKLEQNTAVIAKLQEEIQNLNQQSKDKDLIVDHLKTKIKKTEEDMKALASAKMDLQTQCNNYSTKLTDAEVSYETLRNKAKLREEELLSLLEELNARNKKPEDIGKILSRTLDNELHFMDISKDISLVNSDNEGSIVTAIDEESDHITDIITDSQTQITSRDQIITELQANLLSQQEKISFLENLNQDLQLKVNSFKEKLNTMENANDLLKSTIDTLNSTVKNQQAHLETANNDIESYNSCIQELQIKLLQKANLPNIDINDSVLESMIANEEQFIASNENMKNIIHSLKIALDTRNKEIDILKTTHNNNQELTLEIKTLKEHLEAKTIELNALDVERENMNKQINEYIATINNILQENNNLKVVEHNLSEKLVILEDRVKELEKCSREEAICICNLREENSKLTLEIADNNVAKQEMSETNNQLLKQIDEMRDKITELEKDISIKSDLICSLNKEDKESKEYLVKAKAAVLKSQLILNTLSGNMQEVPEIIDNFVNIFSALSDSMNTLENVANDIVSQKEEAIKNNIDLKNTLEALTAKHNSEITGLQDTINTLRETERNTYQENDTLTHKINHLSVELQVACNELDTKKSENQLLEAHLNQAREKIELCNQQMTALREVKLILDQTLHDKDNLIADKIKKLEAIECVLKDKISEMAIVEERLNNSQQEQHELLTSIYRKMTALTKNFNIENDKTENIEYNCGKIHKQILLTLDKIGNHIAFITSNTADDECKKVSKILLEAKKEIVDLTHRNLNLMQQLSEIENKNSKLSIELKNIKKENKILNEDLLGSQNILQSLHTELKMKALELTEMEGKARDCKEQFTQLDYVMKREMYDLKLENENLKARKKGPDQSVMIYEHTDSYGIDNQDETVKRHVSELSTSAEASSPPSLLTICCNKIIDSIQPKDVESKTTTISSNAQVSVQSDETYVVKCKCNQLSSELETARDENARLLDLLEQLELVNQHLIEEQEAVRSEIQLLAAPAQELQKKIFNHKTNLSILTATTFAENTSLKSQVKGLQHHHSRFHNVCQRDIPDFKKQLRELMTLLKGDPSISDQQNTSFKRYSLPDVLDSSTALPNFKNESTLDGDLLMLDTNITITTAADNTLTGHDQTCLDLTQYYNEAACQTNELNLITDQNIQQMEILSHDNQSMYQKINMLKDENDKLSELVNKFTEIKTLMTDTQTSPIKTNNYVNENLNKSSTINEIEALYKCTKCEKEVELQRAQEKLNDEIKSLAQELCVVKSQKAEMEQKYNDLVLEIPKTDTLVHKLNILEKDYDDKIQDITKLSKTLAIKNQELKNLQDENDALSTQVMENISEADDLNKDLTNLKQNNRELIDKCSILEQSVKEYRDKEKSFNVSCSECIAKDELIQTMEKRLTKTHTKLNRSLSDSDTSSRYNKICTLQSELHAGREDCKELTEDVVTIKNHLERSNLSMDLDDSMGESNIYTFPKDIGMVSPQSNKCIMPDIPEERPSDIYIMDKIDCFNYYAEKTGLNKDNFDRDVKIIELMKIFYENIITKHYNEVENLTNKLKDYNEAKSQLEIQYCELMEKHSQVTTQLEQKDQSYNDVLNILSQIKNNIHFFNQDITEMDNTILINMYKDHILKVLDKGLGLSSVEIFESLIDNIVNKNKTELDKILERNNKLQENMESLTKDLNSINENLAQLKAQLSAKENEYNLLKSQKERIHEINNAVTLDIVKKDKELTETITNGYKRLTELNILNNQVFDLTLPININVNLLFEHLINQHKNQNTDLQKEKEDLVLEVKNSKQAIEEKQKEIEALQSHAKTLREINNGVTMDLVEKENTLQAQKSLHEDLKKIYESKVEENTANVELIEKLSQEIKLLKATIEDKDKAIEKLEMNKNQRNEKDVKITELIDTLKQLKDDISHLKIMNEIIVKEKEAYATELLKSGETIKRNNIEMDRMTSDILILKESVKENGVVIENLNVEVRNLLKQNIQLKEQLEEKCRECFRLETNMKTHEKTAEIQTRMIVRLEKQKNDDDKTMSEKSKQIEELTHKCAALQKQCETLQIFAKERDALEQLKSVKETLEARVAELEMLLEGYKSRQSIDAIADSSRRRRQSLHDSKRIFAEDKNQFEDQNNVEAVFDSRPKPDDLFMDVDEYDSNGSTPIRLSKGHESLSLSRTDQSDKDDEHPSRPSSVVATRRRRQSTHDLHRSVLRHTPSPHGLESANRILDEFNHSKPDTSGGNESEVSQLKQRLASCQQELEDIKEKYRELDEECETCAEYLRERDEQCSRLKKERASLQVTIAELKEKLRSQNQSQLDVLTPSVAHVAVNTDEDWTNLHSVVVDRMSFDAEVEKNKRLTKTIEELRFKKQDLKNTLAKMQKALDKNSGSRELESAKHELHACKQELAQLRQSYKELDEECETCAQYLREKEEQCRRLKEAKTALEAKLLEFQGDMGVSIKTHSTRKKRQSLHDQQRDSTVDVVDASTETSDDFLSYQVERDGSYRPLPEDMQAGEVKRLKSVAENLSKQKAALEQKLMTVSASMYAPHPMYVATGSAIVQNQQLTDVMKENQKLKKINAKLINICKKRGKDSNRENEDPSNQG